MFRAFLENPVMQCNFRVHWFNKFMRPYLRPSNTLGCGCPIIAIFKPLRYVFKQAYCLIFP